MNTKAGLSNGQRRRQRISHPMAGPSQEPLSSPVKKRRPTTLSVGEQEIIINIYKYVRNTWPADAYPSNQKMVEKTSQISGVSRSTVYRILGWYRNNHTIAEKGLIQNKKKTVTEKLDTFQKSAIRRKVHQFFYAGELPTLDKILISINEDEQLPNLSKTSLQRVLRHLNFKYVKRSRKSILIDSPEIVIWRNKYLRDIQQFRNEGRRIFYQDETWVNAGHTVAKIWTDGSVQSARQAFLEGLSVGLKNPSGKGKRLIVVHVGNEEGFLEGSEWIFESSKTGDYHESMDAHHFEEWFKKVLDKLQSGDVIVMDNASYHSRQLDKIPTMSSLKRTIQEWLNSKNIDYLPSDTKAQLINKVNSIKNNCKKYVTDEMAKEKGITVVRLPPYHCELNPIELVWADVKGYVARKNTTFKFKDIKFLLKEGLNQITPEKWKNCVQHVRTIEKNIFGMDDIIDRIADRFIINVTDGSSDSEDTDLDSEGESP